MAKVKIINLKQGACVINSLKIIVPGGGSVIRDDSVLTDPDLVELESAGIIKVVSAEDSPVPKCQVIVVEKETKTSSKQPANAKNAKKDSPKKPEKAKPGTSFQVHERPEDQMGRTAVVMGENGPELKKMNPGINGAPGPKFAGDTADETRDASAKTDDEGFTQI